MIRIALLSLLLFAAACNAVPGASASGAVTPTGSRWLLVELPGADSAPGIRQTLEFPEPGRIAGNGGCNRFGGDARLDGDRLAVSQLVTTRRACAPEAMALEGRYLAALSAVEKVVVEGKALSLHSAASPAPLRFVRIE